MSSFTITYTMYLPHSASFDLHPANWTEVLHLEPIRNTPLVVLVKARQCFQSLPFFILCHAHHALVVPFLCSCPELALLLFLVFNIGQRVNQVLLYWLLVILNV